MTNNLLKTPNLGTGVMEDRDRVDFAELRRSRRDRVFEWMDRAGVDACVFGREANVRYVSGARRLWTALSRPFAPTCVVLREAREVHLLSFSASYEGIPEELQPDEMYPLSWNPMEIVEHLQGLPGASTATVVGVDGLTPLFDGLLRMTFPQAALQGVQPELLDLRRVKLAPEVVCMRISAAIAEAGLVAAIDRLRPGATGKDLQAAYLGRMSRLGAPQFSQLGTFAALDGDGVNFETTGAPIPAASSVALSGGALWAGYEGSLARTWWCGPAEPAPEHRDLQVRSQEALAAVEAECRPGSTGLDLMAALSAGGADPQRSAVYSLGLGHEGLVAASSLGEEAMRRQVLTADMVLGVRIALPGSDRTHLSEDMVLVGETGPEILTTLAHGGSTS